MLSATKSECYDVDFDLAGDMHIAKADIILLTEVIEHLRQPFRFLSNIYSQMKDDAVLYLTTNNLFYIGYILKMIAHRDIYDSIESESAFYPGHNRYYHRIELVDILGKIGFRGLASKAIQLASPVYCYRNFARGMFKKLVSTLMACAYLSHIEIVATKQPYNDE